MSGLILARPQESRRDRLANLVLLRRLPAYSRRLGVEKVVTVLACLGVALASERSWIGLLAAIPAVLGTVMNLLALVATQGDPRSSLLRRYERHLNVLEGLPQLNLPAKLECLGAVCLLLGAGWAVSDLSSLWQLLFVFAATCYTCLVACAIFDDSAWYNPDVRAPAWQEINRALCGLQVCGYVLLASWWAPWDPAERIVLVLIAAIGFIVPLRTASTQLLVTDLGPLVEAERQRGTRLVIEETSRELLPLLAELRQLADDLGPEGAAVSRLADSALAGIADVPNQVAHSVAQGDGQPIRLVTDRLVSLASAAGAELSVLLPQRLELSEDDRQLASLATRDLVGNAITAGATRIYLDVRSIGPRLVIVVADDGQPMPDGAWKSPGSSSAALEVRLAERGGSLMVENSSLSKVVVASWTLAR